MRSKPTTSNNDYENSNTISMSDNLDFKDHQHLTEGEKINFEGKSGIFILCLFMKSMFGMGVFSIPHIALSVT